MGTDHVADGVWTVFGGIAWKTDPSWWSSLQSCKRTRGSRPAEARHWSLWKLHVHCDFLQRWSCSGSWWFAPSSVQPCEDHGRHVQRPNRGPLSRLCFICGSHVSGRKLGRRSGAPVVCCLVHAPSARCQCREWRTRGHQRIFATPVRGIRRLGPPNHLVAFWSDVSFGGRFSKRRSAAEDGQDGTKLIWLGLQIEKMKVGSTCFRTTCRQEWFEIQIPSLNRNRIVQVSRDAEVEIHIWAWCGHITIQTPQKLKFKFPPGNIQFPASSWTLPYPTLPTQPNPTQPIPYHTMPCHTIPYHYIINKQTNK